KKDASNGDFLRLFHLQIPNNWNGQHQDEDIGDKAGDGGEASKADQIDTMTVVRNGVPDERDGGAREAAAKHRNNADGNGKDDESKITHTPCLGCGR
ncbi:MAG: hypothetical protein Q9198_010088, partial [Flavoplaca austrocitrina]